NAKPGLAGPSLLARAWSGETAAACKGGGSAPGPCAAPGGQVHRSRRGTGTRTYTREPGCERLRRRVFEVVGALPRVAADADEGCVPLAAESRRPRSASLASAIASNACCASLRAMR